MHKYVLSFVCCLLFCMGCKDDIETLSNGSLNIMLTDEVAVTRTLPGALSDELQQQFTIELSRDREGIIVPEYKGALKDFGDQRILKVGNYALSAYYGTNPTLALDAPYYYGEVRDITIQQNKSTTVTVNCKVANSLATFEIVNPAAFDKRLKDYYVEVTVGNESVAWKPGDITHPYFKARERVTLALVGTSVETGQVASYALNPIEKVEAGIKYNYKLSMKASNVGFDINVETHPETITINETVPDNWLPKAKVFSDDFNEEHLLIYTETAEPLARASVSYTALRPVQDVEFALVLADDHLKHLNKTYVLSQLSDEDRQALAAVNIVLPDLSAGSTNGAIDFAGVTSGMLTHDGGQNTDNVIGVRVKANDRWSEAVLYTIRTVKPIFKVGYYPGNVWTKEFTLNTLTADSVKTGNLNKFTNLTYEFSADGSTWEAMPENLQKTALNPGTSYYVRAKYRGEVSSEVTEVKTYPQIVLENGGLETYSIVRGKDGTGFLGGDYGAQYEWSSWATLNELTAGQCVGTAYSYNTRSGTRPVSDIRPLSNGKAAVWIITVGYGYGGTHNSPKSVIPSELFLGQYNSKGISYESRPTGVHFWYKYAPYDNDKADIKIELLHQEIVIGHGTFQESASTSAYKEHIISVVYDDEYKNLSPDRISLVFKSGFNTSVESRESGNLTSAKTANPKFRGSELFIDDIELIYDK